jgi:serine/threonine-protein kinase
MTGRLPFVAPNYHALVDAIVSNAPVPLTDLAAGDSWLWTIVERGLEKDPTMRWGSMRQLGRELAAWAVERGVTTDSMGVAIAPIWLDEESDQPLLAPRMSITNPGGRPARRTPISADIRLSTRPGPLAPEAPEEPHHAPLPSLTEPVALSSTQAPPPIKRRMGAVLGFIAGAIVAAGAFAFFATRPSTDGRAPAAGPPTLAMASASPPVVEALVADLGREQIVAPPAPSASASTAAAASASAAGSKRPRARPSVPAAKAAPTAAAQIDPPPKPTPLIPTDPNF